MKFYRASQRGFTLIELLVVIAIIGLLSSIVMASLNSARIKAREAQRTADVRSVIQALQMYYLDNGGRYPIHITTGDSHCSVGWCLGSVVSTYLVPRYISRVPADPVYGGTGSNYRYCSSAGLTYSIIRYSEDIGGWCRPQQPFPYPVNVCGAAPNTWDTYPEC